eukprot:CAMPEP_0173140026 /NCGR_PEP_ID=MMETSP1105-20130129/4623_1 /TAXON_ID=2985 /ORGANISM="Ochromonas sp., Strain BG-1" /LENGTH=160 /DNA_ID=CAMNT_0014052899 /DNA_START=127 /DNA_END=609 /DNA_ORIENTATION=-
MASVGFRIPGNVTVHEDNPDKKFTTEEIFAGKKVVLFGVPGAFTPGCSKTHLPGYIADYQKFKDKGVDEIICVSVNDPFVTGAWAEAHNAAGKVRVLADVNAELAKALGVDIDLTAVLGSVRSKRYSAYVVDSEIKVWNVEADGTGLTCSLANGLLAQIN